MKNLLSPVKLYIEKKPHYYRFKKLIPKKVYKFLREDEIAELNKTYHTGTTTHHLATQNKGIWFLLLDGRNKYEFLKTNPYLDATDLCNLWEYSNTHLDEYHRALLNESHEEYLYFEQSILVGFAAIANSHASPDLIHRMFTYWKNNTPYPVEDTIKSIGERLLKEPVVHKLDRTVIETLVKFFTENNQQQLADKYAGLLYN